MKPRASPLSLRARALQALAQREYSRAELRAKLLRTMRGRASAGGARDSGEDASAQAEESPDDPATAQAAVDCLLDELQAKGLLNDARFIESRVHVRAPRFGLQRIRQELQRHGVALDAETAETLSRTERQRAQAVWARRFGQAPIGVAEQAQQMRFLGARGFSAEVVRQVVRQAMRDALSERVTDGADDELEFDAEPVDPCPKARVHPDREPI